MVSVKMDGYPAVGPRVGLLVATHAFWIDRKSTRKRTRARVPTPPPRALKLETLEFNCRILEFGQQITASH